MMIDIKDIKSVYLIGIGGIGMSALARYFASLGKTAGGYDRTPTLLTDELQNEGIDIHFSDDVKLIAPCYKDKNSALVIYTPAIPNDHSEYDYFVQGGFHVMNRAEVLGLITKAYDGMCVAGTHGKTTTSGLVGHILRSSSVGCSAFLGGITNNYGTNYWSNANSSFVVVEADEFDRSFLHLTPHLALITSMDADHLDIYGDSRHVTEAFNLFAQKVQPGGALVVKNGLPLDEMANDDEVEIFTYGVNDREADFSAINIQLVDDLYRFDLVTPFGSFRKLELGIPGMHNLENAVGASALALLAGVEKEELTSALKSYSGNRRRFQFRIRHKNFCFIDDYAHHPAEIKAMIGSMRQTYPGRRLTVVFQPHLFTRTRDFAADFAASLDLADRILLLDIYPAREQPIEGVTSDMLLQLMKNKNGRLVTKDSLFESIVEQPLDLLVTMGAGNIDALVPDLENKLNCFISK